MSRNPGSIVFVQFSKISYFIHMFKVNMTNEL